MEKHLTINGKEILFSKIDNQYWIALKPISDAFGSDWVRQFKNVKKHKTLSQLLSNTTMVGADNRKREMVALPEKYIYGWIFSINSNNQTILNFQMKCYEVLYEYFHNAISQRFVQLSEKLETKKLISDIELRLKTNNDYIQLQDLRAKEMRLGKNLKELDNDFLNNQISIKFD